MGTAEPVAIVGMGCIFPGAPDLVTYWSNILAGKDCITAIPPERDRLRREAALLQGDSITCRRGGFLPEEHAIAPADYGIMPGICEKVDPEQILVLETIDRALEDAGIHPEDDDLSHTETILGRGGYLGNYLQQVHMRVEIIPQVLGILRRLQPGIDSDTLAGIGGELQSAFAHLDSDRIPFGIPNLTTGRPANRFDCMGGNYTVDAACASALVAADNSIMAIASGRAERVITGGVFLANNPSFWWTFSRLGALSTGNMIRPFSADADGMLVGEGLGILVLEPLSLALESGRRIYALLRGSATSSDGRGNAVLAPRGEGQLACLKRAYEHTGIDPLSIDLVEGHGTGTAAGDQVEIASLVRFFGEAPAGVPVRALGSVKSMIGHLMPAAGAAAMIKTALSLYHRLLPPTLHAEKPAEALKGSSFYLNDRPRPWVHSPASPRRAGINAFGFGGINAHVILEEADPDSDDFRDLPMEWPTELFLFSGEDNNSLRRSLEEFRSRIMQDTASTLTPAGLARLSHALCTSLRADLPVQLSMTGSTDTLPDLLTFAMNALETGRIQQLETHEDIGFTTSPLGRTGKVVFIFPGNAFPGLGDDYTERLSQLSCHLPFFRRWFDLLDARYEGKLPYPFSTMLFSPPGLDQQRLVELKKELRLLGNSAAGVFMANSAGQDLMMRLGVRPDMVTGTSLGEWSALMAGGIITFEDVAAMGIHLSGTDGNDIRGGLGLAQCAAELIYPVIEDVDNTEFGRVSCALDLSQAQVVFGGDRAAVREVSRRMQEKGVWAEAFNMTPIHTPLCAPIAEAQHRVIGRLAINPATVPVYSGSTAAPYPRDADRARALLADNTVLPVRMRELFSRLHDDGARIFLQLGGGGKILGPLQETLSGKPFFASALDAPNTHPVTQLQRIMGDLVSHGLDIKPDILFSHRIDLLRDSDASSCKRGPEATLHMAVPRLEVQTELPGSLSTNTAADTSAPQPQRPPRTGIQALLQKQISIAAKMIDMQQDDDEADWNMSLNLLRQQHRLICDGLGTATTHGTRLPFTGTVIEHVPGSKLVINYLLDPAKDTFLLDHTFIPLPDSIKPGSERLPTLPMAMALEIMAETALTLMPGKKIKALENIVNRRWIDVDSKKNGVMLTITVEKKDQNNNGSDRVSCSIASDITPDLLHVTGDVILAGYMQDAPAAPGAEKLLNSATPCHLDPTGLYKYNRLYHGPCFQGIHKLHLCAENGISGVIKVPALKNFFSNGDRGEMVLAPAVIDAASQLIACWAWERGDRHFWVAPVAMERLETWGTPPCEGDELDATLAIHIRNDKTLTFDLFLSAGNALWCRITGWQDYCMTWPHHFMDVWQDAADTMLSEELLIPEAGECSLRQIEASCLKGVELQWAARLFLHSDELEAFEAQGPAARLPWFLGRIAAKDAVRIELQRMAGITGLFPPQVKIVNDGTGRPLADIEAPGIEIPNMHISISHKKNRAVAAASAWEKISGIGIDLESGLEEMANLVRSPVFTEREAEFLKGIPEADRAVEAGRLWCAKEAAAKAAGLDTPFVATHYPVKTLRSGHADMVVCMPGSHNSTIKVITTVKEWRIIAVGLLNSSGND